MSQQILLLLQEKFYTTFECRQTFPFFYVVPFLMISLSSDNIDFCMFMNFQAALKGIMEN